MTKHLFSIVAEESNRCQSRDVSSHTIRITIAERLMRRFTRNPMTEVIFSVDENQCSDVSQDLEIQFCWVPMRVKANQWVRSVVMP